jgi:hypothetical protein
VDRNASGYLLGETDHFPNGMKPVVDYVHEKGMDLYVVRPRKRWSVLYPFCVCVIAVVCGCGCAVLCCAVLCCAVLCGSCARAVPVLCGDVAIAVLCYAARCRCCAVRLRLMCCAVTRCAALYCIVLLRAASIPNLQGPYI